MHECPPNTAQPRQQGLVWLDRLAPPLHRGLIPIACHRSVSCSGSGCSRQWAAWPPSLIRKRARLCRGCPESSCCFARPRSWQRPPQEAWPHPCRTGAWLRPRGRARCRMFPRVGRTVLEPALLPKPAPAAFVPGLLLPQPRRPSTGTDHGTPQWTCKLSPPAVLGSSPVRGGHPPPRLPASLRGTAGRSSSAEQMRKDGGVDADSKRERLRLCSQLLGSL